MSWVLNLPAPSPSLNSWLGNHWRVRARLKAEWDKDVFYCAKAAHVPPAPGKRNLRITRFSLRTLDQDNLIGGNKPVLDALTKNGIIRDDSPAWVEVEYLQAKGNPGTRIEIWEAS